MLADRTNAKAGRRLEEHDVRDDDSRKHDPDQEIEIPEDVEEEVADHGDVLEEAERDVGDA